MRNARATGGAVCPDCKQEMNSLFYKIRIPKRKPKLWKQFKEWLSNNYPNCLTKQD